MKGKWGPWWLWTLVPLAATAAWAGWDTTTHTLSPSPLPRDRTDNPNDAYVSSDKCRACHPDAYDTWYGSYHRTMTQPASEAAIVAQWEGTLEHDGRTYELKRNGEQFLVTMPAYGTDGTHPADRVTREVHMTTGSHHMQIYWVATPWAMTPPLKTGAVVFDTHCGSCHADNADHPLSGRELVPVEIADTLQDPNHQQHLTTPLTDAQLTAAQKFVEQLQVQGNLQQFPFAWWIRGQRWLHEEHTFLQPPPDVESVELWEQHWSDNCDQCHSVGPHNLWNRDTARLEASISEFGISCEACHGPARDHAETYQNPISRYLARMGKTPPQHITNPSRLDHERASALCGQCHGELVFPKGEGNDTWFVGERLEDHVNILQLHQAPYPEWIQDVLKEEPDLLDAAFWKDGTMRVAGRDYNAMVLSGCYTKGEMSCMSCHDLHGHEPDDQLKPGHRGDTGCAECHPVQAQQGSAHTHHAPDSEGSRCMNCHMPNTTLGLLGAMRSHRIDSPNANTADQTGRPDACSLCHLDQPLSKTAQALTQWYGQPPLENVRYSLDEPSAAILWYLKGDAAQRALIGWHMGWGPAQQASGTDWMAPFLSYGLQDDYSAARYISGVSLQTLPGFESTTYDYTLTPDHFKSVGEQVRKHWSNTTIQNDRPALLMTPTLDWDRLETYIMMQDKSPVSVSE